LLSNDSSLVSGKPYIQVMEITIEDPRAQEVSALLQKHLDFCHSVTPAENVFALDVEKLRLPGIALFGARDQGELVGVCALKLITSTHAELKSMHVLPSSRGKGIGGLLVSHVLDFARAGGIERVSLETSPDDAFAPARRLYASRGFVESGPFAD
jgi:putative acetyltransferase